MPDMKSKVYKIDSKARSILKQIIRDPRASDNRISRLTGIPVKTVGRKRKFLEDSGILSYHASVDNYRTGTFDACYLFEVQFRLGISRNFFIDRYGDAHQTAFESKHIQHSMLGEINGQLVWLMFIESRNENDMLEIYNSEIIPKIKDLFGHDAVTGTRIVKITKNLRIMHNYIYGRNLTKGKIDTSWPDELVFVSDLS